MSALFIDESKSRRYTLAAAAIRPADADALRRAVRALVLPGQRRIHFTHESDRRRKWILSTLDDLGVRAHLFESRSPCEPDAREDCLVGLVAHANVHGHSRLVLERDDSIEKFDRRILFREVQTRGLRGTLEYVLEAPHAEPLLWIPDALAWSHTKGGEWRSRAAPMLTGLTRV